MRGESIPHLAPHPSTEKISVYNTPTIKVLNNKKKIFQQVAESAALFLAGFNPGLPSVSVQQSSSPLPANLTFHPEDTGEH